MRLSFLLFLIPLLLVAGIVMAVVAVVNHVRRDKTEASVAKGTPRDTFLYLLGTFLLFVCAIGTMVLVASLARVAFPVETEFQDADTSATRFGIATLAVAFPLFLYLSNHIRRRIRRGEMDPSSMLRHSLIYLTMFVLTMTVMIDLMIVVNTFLKGEITARFVIQAVGGLAIAGGVYAYVSSELKLKQVGATE